MKSFIELKKFKKKTALILDNDEEVSYLNLNNKVEKLRKNIKKNSLIFILCNNDLETIAMYLACLRNKTICLLIEENLNLEYLKKLIKIYKPEYIFSDYKKKINNFKIIFKYRNKTLFKNKEIKKKEYNSKLSVLLTTSGSTGTPKLAKLSYDNLNFNAISISKYSNISSKDVMVTTLNPAYSFGLSMINSHLLKGAKIILNKYSIISKNFFEKLSEFKVSTVGGVPFMYEIFDRLKIFEKKNFINKLLQAGGSLNIDLQKKFANICNKKKIRFFIMYGQTEASPRISYLPPEKFSKKIGSIGIPIPQGKIEIVDENGDLLTKPYKVGEMVYYGKNVFLGYAQNIKDLKKKDNNFGKLNTGDFAYRDQESFFYIVGRKKRIVKLFGKRINLDEIEKIINKSNIINACISRKEKLIVFICNKKISSVVTKILNKNLNLNKIAFEIKHISKLPKLNNGKINYMRLNNIK